ncbi:MAG: hypothetical protein KDK91_12530 [Gammaproteobacteria bacterium]|nr:hypothetical protein [Gammaproteobacteria bacterium]
MSNNNLSIVFQGELIDGFDGAEVRTNLARLFKADAQRIEAMFTGRAVVIKKALDPDGARHYEAALARAGARVAIVDPGAAPTPPTPSPPRSAPPTSRADAADLASGPNRALAMQRGDKPSAAELGEAARALPARLALDADGNPPPPPVAPDLPLDEPGVELVESHAPPPVDIDTSHLQLAALGVDLAEQRAQPIPTFNLDGLSLAPPGEDLTGQIR